MPRLATFAVDQGFWYTIPETLANRVQVGSIVRVPLSGRRVRGYVVEVSGARDGLKDIASVSGAAPVFSPSQLRSLEWAASHYVAPLSVLLDRAAPPNLPGSIPAPPGDDLVSGAAGLLDDVARAAAGGGHRPPIALVGRFDARQWLTSLGAVLEAGRSASVIVSTAAEAEEVHATAHDLFGHRASLATGDADRDLTTAWVAAQSGGRVLVGTPRISAWLIEGLAISVVVEEGRRAMKDRQTPTIHVRDLMLTRGRIEGFTVVFAGPTPSVEVLAAGAEVLRVGSRSWSLVEVVDRREEGPGVGYLSERALAALRGVKARGGRSFVFTHRRATDASTRCARCRALRLCARCGSRTGREGSCRRCGQAVGPCQECGGDKFETLGTIPEQLSASINRVLGAGSSGPGDSDLPVVVGTERDLAAVTTFDLVVVADADGLVLAQNYRAGEEALRIIARLGNLVAPGTGRRLMVQTSTPESDLMATLRSGDPMPYLESVLVDRARDGLPPSTDMLAVELRGVDDPGEIGAALQAADAPLVMGPARTDQGYRWLIQGELGRFRLSLRSLTRTWRDRGLTVRLDADPIDL